MSDKTFKMLDFDKIVSLLSTFAESDDAKAKIFDIKPCFDIHKVEIMQNETAEAVEIISLREAPSCVEVKNILNIIKRVQKNGVLSIADCIKCGIVLKTSSELRKSLENSTVLNTYRDSLISNKQLQNKIFSTFKDDETVDDYASKELLRIRRNISSIKSNIDTNLAKFISKNSSKLQDVTPTIRNNRSCVAVKAEHKSTINGVVHGTSASGSTIFIEPSFILESNNKIAELHQEEAKEIHRILAEFSSEILDVSHELFVAYNTIIKLDIIFAKARLSLAWRATKPTLNDNGYINLVKARHPLIPDETVVPLDFYIGKNFNSLVITGPNTGGKTATIKTVGLLTLMACCGMQIPAKIGSSIAIFDSVFVDIGDEQSLEQSLSTFSSHITNIIDILKNFTNDSLVLIDELGAGTDPDEGSALAISILKYIQNVGATCVSTTHYSQLKLFATTQDGMENASCEFDINTLSPTYKLIIGIPGKSNALDISKRLGVPNKILDDAVDFMSTTNVNFEAVLDDIRTKTFNVSKLEQELQSKVNELYKEKNKYIKKTAELRESKAKQLDKVREKASKIIADAKNEAAKIISELKTENDVIKARTKLNQFEKETMRKKEEKTIENTPPPKCVKKGQIVRLLDINQKGEALSDSKKDGTLTVQIGVLKMSTTLDNVRIIQEKVKNVITTKIGNKVAGKSQSLSVDLRGMYAEDAVLEAERFIDNSVRNNMNQITIIHGKGTGVLRSNIHKMLNNHPLVKNFRLGTFGEGESGVTVVELK
ncbi:MAG: endonuclease MutS2 [Clostridiales bacterium]|jgi:DNA mismatch repair protein MutS2|nr:endonuclease MutS2 [Clostridiales bacterium]